MKKIKFILNGELVQVELTDEIFVNEFFTKKHGFKIANISTKKENTRKVFYSWIGSTDSVDSIVSCRVNFKTEDGMADCPMNNKDKKGIFSARDKSESYIKDMHFEKINDLLLISYK